VRHGSEPETRRPVPGAEGRRGGRLHLLAGSVAVMIALAAAMAFFPRLQAGTAHAAANDVVEIHAAHGDSYVAALQGARPLFVLALGSDARPGEPILNERADSIHIIGVNLKTHRATILGFPRDSWVNIPGHGTNKINTALTFGGPSLLIQTIESISGIRIDFWMLTSFPGLIGMVNGIGGLDVNVPRPMNDHYSGADFSAGQHHLNGGQTLAFSRDRHDVPGGDLGRSQNQGRVLLAALAKLHKTFANDPTKLFNWLVYGSRNLATDIDFSTLLDLALTATTIPSSNVNNLVVPATVGSVGAASVVFLLPSAASIYADMRADGVVG
jgi:LCP family protein required for cell wall assembly